METDTVRIESKSLDYFVAVEFLRIAARRRRAIARLTDEQKSRLLHRSLPRRLYEQPAEPI